VLSVFYSYLYSKNISLPGKNSITVKSSEIQKIFESFNNFQILIIGDVMIDAYLWGKVERISPEAPIPIITSTKKENRLGGAANVALNIKALGAKPLLCSVIGNDDKSKVFLERLRIQSIDNNGIILNNKRKTTVKTRIISNNQHLLRIDEEDDEYISSDLEKEFFNKILSLISNNKIDAIVFEDYDKGIITPFIIEKTVELAKKNNIPTLVDPKKRNFNHYRNITLFKPNFREITNGLKVEIKKGDFEALLRIANTIHKERQIDKILITLSELGVYISDNGKHHIIPAEVREVVDVSGAGDTLISIAALCLTAGLPSREIAVIANLAGGLVCEKIGVVPVDKQELLRECIKALAK
jgi:rfaE bifunctional protein kinase chain/domain